jgi:hypothetical protein
VVVVVSDELGQYRIEMPTPEDEQPIVGPQEVRPGRAGPPRSRVDAMAAKDLPHARRGGPNADIETLCADARAVSIGTARCSPKYDVRW